MFSYKGKQYATQGGDGVRTMLKNTDTLLNSVFYTELPSESSGVMGSYNVYYVDSRLNANALAIGCTQFAVAENGTEILCIVDNGIYRVSAYNAKKPERLVTPASMFCTNGSTEEFYFIDTSGNLYDYKNGRGSIQVTGVQLAKLMKDGTVIAYAPTESNGTLLWMKDGRSNAIATDVAFFEVYPNAVMYLKDYDELTNTYDLYVGSDGVNFELGIENIGIK